MAPPDSPPEPLRPAPVSWLSLDSAELLSLVESADDVSSLLDESGSELDGSEAELSLLDSELLDSSSDDDEDGSEADELSSDVEASDVESSDV
ncbi:hypothetical protein LPJ70_001112, partial [Coemansia sp. RSA 2708]